MEQKLSKTQLLWIVISFNLGSAILLLPGILVNTAAQDAWIPLTLGAFLSLLVLLPISKLSCLYPNLSFVQYSEKIMGKLLGKMIGVIWCWFAMHLGSLVVRNFTDFFNLTMLPNTPTLAISALLFIPIILALYQGIGSLGILAQAISPFVLILFVGITFNMLPNMSSERILPLFEQDLMHITWGSIQALSFPFGESILFASLLLFVKNKSGCSKVLIKGVLIAAALLLLGLVRTLLALGVDETQRLYFAVLEPSRREAFGFVRGLEIFIIVNWFNFAFFKIAVCLYAFCQGVSNLINSDRYKPFIIPAVIIMISLSKLSYENIVQEVNAAAVLWPVYAVPIEVLLPLSLLAVAMIRKAREN